ncbi:chemotaxis protein CheB, partial [Morganella morganii]|uniref:chemotaxis protein CheB n=1 Tax=Morganella morganii TaxID=582 RepID=UPI003CD0D467
MTKITQGNRLRRQEKETAARAVISKPLTSHACHKRLVAVGRTTGGTEAIRQFLEMQPPECPPVVITKHRPAGFTRSFAERMNKLCALTVKEAEHGDV